MHECKNASSKNILTPRDTELSSFFYLSGIDLSGASKVLPISCNLFTMTKKTVGEVGKTSPNRSLCKIRIF